MKACFLPLLFLVVSSCHSEETLHPTPPETAQTDRTPCAQCTITSADIVGEFVSIPYVGDLWATTWGKDDTLYAAFGDATGTTQCLPTLFLDQVDEFDSNYTEISPGLYTVVDQNNEYCQVFSCDTPLPLCQYTPAGLLALNGEVPVFTPCEGPDQCVISRHIPYGNYDVFIHSDKPSSILAVND